MKTILITSDFSENSIDAAHVGIELARLFHAKVILMHVYSLPLPTSEFPEMIDFSAYENIKSNQLEQLRKKLLLADVEIEALTVPGLSFYEEVKNLAEHRKIVTALGAFRMAAEVAGRHEYVEFADELALHAQNEEQVTYPAALLVGRYVKLVVKR